MPNIQPTKPTATELLERARSVAQLAAHRAQETERQRYVADDVISAMKDSGVLRVLQPSYWGGYEMDLATFVRVGVEIATGDTSYLHHPMQRIWRDVHAVNQHLGLQYDFALEGYGRTLVGLPSGSMM